MGSYVHEFPKANDFDPTRHLGPFMVEEKLDGESVIIASGQAFGRRIGVSGIHENKWCLMPEKIKKMALGCPVHGELYVRGGTSSDVKTAIKEAHEGGGELADRLGFCAYRLVGQPLQPHEHLDALMKMGFEVPRVLSNAPEQGEFTQAVVPWEYATRRGGIYVDEPALLDLRDLARRERIEGFMLKKAETIPVWFKLKVEDTADVIVTGVKDGDGKYLGLVGALLCSVLGSEGQMIEVASVSGMTDDERYEITEMHDKHNSLVGRVCEIKYQCVAAQGRLRHPRFLRFREDKNPMECTIAQLERDL